MSLNKRFVCRVKKLAEILKYSSYFFPQKIGLTVDANYLRRLHEMSNTIFWKNKKNVNLSSFDLAQRVVKFSV